METLACEMDDRISQLPESIVHHILSFIYTSPAELVRMSVLSKTWFNLTASFPFLDFSIDDFKCRKSFFKYVEYTTSRFCHHNVTAHTLTLNASIQKPAELDIVNRCLVLLLKNGLREFLIDLTDYRLPDILLSVSVLQSLTICGCNLPSSIMVDPVKFKCLLYLELENLRLEDEVINYLATSCPLLQVLYIRSCYGFKRFCIYGHQNLQDVWIGYNTPVERIDIEAQSLSTLVIIDVDGRGPPQMNLTSCKKLTSVSYDGYLLPNSNGFTDFSSNFPFLTDLFLETNYKCDTIKLSSHSLRTLMLRSNCGLDEIEFSTPNLGFFIYCNAWYPWPEIRHLHNFKACMGCYLNGSIDVYWFHELRLFLDKKNGFKALNLYIHINQKFIVLEKLKEILPPYELEHIELHFQHEKSSAAIVDVVLWYFRPQSLTLRSSFFLTDFEDQSDLVKFTYKKLLEQEDQGCTSIQIVSTSSTQAQKQFKGLMFLPVPLPHDEKAISFIKEEVVHEEAESQRFSCLEIS